MTEGLLLHSKGKNSSLKRWHLIKNRMTRRTSHEQVWAESDQMNKRKGHGLYDGDSNIKQKVARRGSQWAGEAAGKMAAD